MRDSVHFRLSRLPFFLVSTFGVATAPAVELTFNEHVQPILSEYCYQCHGPDASSRKPKSAPLRLDRAASAFEVREELGTPVIIKGNPEDSEFYRRLITGDDDELMPPRSSHKVMKKEEIVIVRKWIEEGAEYEDHWSFTAPVRPVLPDLPEALASWPVNPIDHFTGAKLTAAGLAPNPESDPRRLLRRLTFDLTGLPPTPAEIDSFVQAWEAERKAALDGVLDRLFASPAYGEHFGRHWLDAARYADTHGIHIDNYRAIWPYRDWVVEAFRQNLPWDQFTIEQIAGDLLPEATLDQRIATGFNRCLATTGEGGAIAEEYEAIYAQDRVDTTAAVWLGLTTGCASCHDHKFDPLTMKDFYSLTAFFRNTTMRAMDGNNAEHPPNLFAPHQGDRARWVTLERELVATNDQVAERRATARPEFESWLATATIESPRSIDSTLHLHLPLAGPAGPLRGTVDGKPREWPAELSRIDGPLGQAPVISEKPVELGDLASFGRSDRVSFGGFIRIEGNPSGSVIARMNPDQGFRGWDLWLEQGRPGTHVIDSWDKAANKMVANPALEPGTWHHVFVTFNGSKSGHQASAIYIDGKRAKAKLSPNSVGGTIETSVPLRLGARHNNASPLAGGKVALQDFRFYRRLLTPAEIGSLAQNAQLRGILARPAEMRTKEQEKVLYDYYLANLDTPSRDLQAKLDTLEQEKSAMRSRGSVTLVMAEKPKSEPAAHILTRGDYSQKAERVTADVPEVLPALPDDAPRNRLGLARWLVSRDNPLSARVTMNRTWYYLFGRGIVETTEDFGITGARPTHPRLLDWLAVEFMDSGWDYQHMLRLITTSATYRQSQGVSKRKLEVDPENVLISRGPRYRMDAEQIRDLALASSGLLSKSVGGPPVKPYQPDGIWSAVAMPQSNTRNYKQDTGEKLYRRSLYTFWKRTAPHPAMEILNAPSREVFCVRRERTNTPLQAFVTMNDVQFVEASRHLATRALKASPDTATRLDTICLNLLGRPPRDAEMPILEGSLKQFLEAYRAAPEEAAKLIALGDSSPDPTIDASELAAWLVLTSEVFNLDETLTK